MQLCNCTYKGFRIWEGKQKGMDCAEDKREISSRREWVTVF